MTNLNTLMYVNIHITQVR